MTLDPHPVWPFSPNWNTPVAQIREWLTDILTSPTGAEQRIARRPRPRRYVEFDVALIDRERAYADNLMDTYGSSDWWLPLWFEANMSQGTINPGATTITLDKQFLGLGPAVIWQSPFRCEAVEVTAMSGNTLTLDSPVANLYTSPTYVFPAVASFVTDQPRFTKQSDKVWTGEMRFILKDRDNVGLPPALTPSYLNFPVFDTPPDETERLTVSYERMLDELDNKVAHPVYNDTADRPFSLYKYKWTVIGRPAVRDFEQFTNGLVGRQKPVWMPTFHSDFDIISATTTTLTVADTGYLITGGPRRDKQHIRIYTTAGTFYRRITNATIVGQNERLTLDSPLPITLTPSNTIQISFMSLVRLNSDTLQMEHLTDTHGVMTCEAIFRSAPDLRAITIP